MLPLTSEQRRTAGSVAAELAAFKHKLAQLGFVRTLKEFDKAINEFGFELAERAAFTDHGAAVAHELGRVHRRYKRAHA